MQKTAGDSSGEPFTLEPTIKHYASRTAAMWPGNCGVRAGVGKRKAHCWRAGYRQGRNGRYKERHYRAKAIRYFLDLFRLAEDRIACDVDATRTYPPKAIAGYVAHLLLSERWIRTERARLPSVESVLSSAEALYATERAEDEKAFACPVFNTYGCRELELLAAACEMNGALHVTTNSLVLATIYDGRKAAAAASGDAIVADVRNCGTSFIRDFNDHRATYLSTFYAHGHSLPLQSSGYRRKLSTIVAPGGRYSRGHGDVPFVLGIPSVSQYFTVQAAAIRIRANIVAKSGCASTDRVDVNAKLRDVVSDATPVAIERVGPITPSPSGKRRIIVSRTEAAKAQ